MWTGRKGPEALRRSVNDVCRPVIAEGFQFEESENGQALFLVRRQRLSAFLEGSGEQQIQKILGFLTQGHEMVTLKSGVLRAVYERFRQEYPWQMDMPEREADKSPQ